MLIGICRIRLRLPENQSLKGKRQVVKSVIARVRNKFNVSVAEVDSEDMWQLVTLGVTCVSNDGQHANEMLSHVVDFVVESRLDAEILDYDIEILSVP